MWATLALSLALEPAIPPPLDASAAACVNVLVANRSVEDTKPFVSLNGLTARNGKLEALLFVSRFPVSMPQGDTPSRALYYQYDDGPPTYLETASPASQTQYGLYFQRVVFANLTLGPHRLAYGLFQPGSGLVAYGQTCFVVRSTEYEYFIGGRPDEREKLVEPKPPGS